MDDEEGIVRRQLGNARVRNVHVHKEVNGDGAEVRRVFVVYERSKGALTTEEMSDTTDALWLATLKSEIKTSPVISYVSSEDVEDGAYAAQ